MADHESAESGASAGNAGKAPSHPRLILVTDPAYPDDRVVDVVKACVKALPAGAFCVQLRDRRKDAAQLRTFAERLREATRVGGAKLLVNGNAALARDVGADGVHLGGNAMKVFEARAVFGAAKCFISIAAHSDDAVRLGAQDGADAALVSAIFSVPGKAVGRGLGALASARTVAPAGFLLYALGGVDPTNARDCVNSGADGVALIRALLLAADPAAAARAIFESLTTSP